MVGGCAPSRRSKCARRVEARNGTPSNAREWLPVKRFRRLPTPPATFLMPTVHVTAYRSRAMVLHESPRRPANRNTRFDSAATRSRLRHAGCQYDNPPRPYAISSSAHGTANQQIRGRCTTASVGPQMPCRYRVPTLSHREEGCMRWLARAGMSGVLPLSPRPMPKPAMTRVENGRVGPVVVHFVSAERYVDGRHFMR